MEIKIEFEGLIFKMKTNNEWLSDWLAYLIEKSALINNIRNEFIYIHIIYLVSTYFIKKNLKRHNQFCI